MTLEESVGEFYGYNLRSSASNRSKYLDADFKIKVALIYFAAV